MNDILILFKDNAIYSNGLVGLLTALVAFLIARVGYRKRYNAEIKKLQNDIDIGKTTIEKNVFETYSYVFKSLNEKIKEIESQKNELLDEIRLLKIELNNAYVQIQELRTQAVSIESKYSIILEKLLSTIEIEYQYKNEIS